MSRTSPAKIARDAFAEGAISLLRRALAEGLGARIVVDPNGVETHADLYDADGVVHLTHQLHATQLALPLAGPVERAPSQSPPAAPAVCVDCGDFACALKPGESGRCPTCGAQHARPVEVPTARVWIEEAEWDALDGGMQNYLCGVSLRGDACGTAPVPIDWQGAVGFVVARAPVGEVLDELVATLRDAGIEHHVGDEAPVRLTPPEEPPPVEAPKPAAAKKPRAKKAPTKAAAPAVEAPAPGVWQLIERLRDGSTEHNEWVREDSARAFFAHSRKRPEVAYAQLADPSGAMVDEYTAPAGDPPSALWRLVEHPIGAAPRETPCDEETARRLYPAAVAYGGDKLRRVELFDDVGLLTFAHNFTTAPAQPARGLDGVPASVPAHLRDLAALTSPDWWCVVVQQAVRPDLTAVKLCPDESTAVATAERARLEDDSANNATRIVVFTAAGEVHDAWHRWSPVVSAAVEAHPEAELFRVATPMTDAFSDVALWAGARGLAWFASGYQRNSPAEVREGDAWLHWGRQNSDAVAIVPRALVALVERRAAGWKLDLHIEPWTATAECSALRVGSRVELRGEEWRVFLLPDHETATLTRGDDELADVALAEVHPSGTGGWWAERAKPKAAKAEKKAPKRAVKAVA